MTTKILATLTDDQLVAEAKRAASDERRATAALLRVLIELDSRKLYLREGCSSMFTYCTQVLRLAEGAAYNRIEAARAARRYPVILDALEQGSVTLTTIRLLAPHLTTDNHIEVIAAACHKSKRQVEELVAALAPRPAVPASVRRLPAKPEGPPLAAVALMPAEGVAAGASALLPPTFATDHQQALAAVAPRAAPVVTPLAPERYKLQLTISRDTHEKLRKAQDLLRHAIPTADPAEILDRALTLLIADTERRRLAATESPRAPGHRASGSRHIPAAVRRAVWKRDGGRCAFVGRSGRCSETAFLQFHHVQPYAAGGAATEDNISLRCSAHNAYEADLFFGGDVVRERADAWWMSGPVPNSFRNELSAARSSRRTMRPRRAG